MSHNITVGLVYCLPSLIEGATFVAMQDELTKVTSYAVIAFTKLCLGTKDQFFMQRAYLKLANFISLLITYNASEVSKIQLQLGLDEILEFIDYLEYLKISDDTALFTAKKNLLNLKIALTRTDSKESPKAQAFQEPQDINIKTSESEKKKPEQATQRDLSEVPKKIIALISLKPGLRVKEICEELKSFSPRTIKRHLAELTKTGVLKRAFSDGTVSYSI